MWEWRTFFPLTEENETDVWNLLHYKTPPGKPSIRKDSYLVLTDSIGVKLRGGENLEVKIRVESHDSGAELWTKVVARKLQKEKRDPEALRSELELCLRDQIHKQESKPGEKGKRLIRLLQDAVEAAKRPLALVTIHKQRVSQAVGSVCVEQTDLIIIDCLAGTQWRTVCLEGDVGSVCSLLKSPVGKTDLQSCLTKFAPPRGYPEFVIRLSQDQI